MSAAPVADALDVIGRTVHWLAGDSGRNLDRARYVETTLGRWTQVLVGAVSGDLAGELQDDLAAAQEALAGFDSASVDDRAERVARLLMAHTRIRSRLGEAVPELSSARAVLLPAGIAADLPPRLPRVEPPPAPVIDLSGSESSTGAVASGEERGSNSRGPEGRSSDARNPGARGSESRSAGDRTAGGRGEGHRGEHGRVEGGRGEGGRPHRGQAGSGPESREVEVEVRPPPPPPVAAPPPPPPPPPTFPLGHPEQSGLPVSVLGASESEVELLAAIDVQTVADLLLIPPSSLDRAGERVVDGVPPEGRVLVRGKVSRRITRISPNGRRFEITLGTDRGALVCRWLGAVPVEVLSTRSGASLGLAGRYDKDEDQAVLYEGEPLGIDGRGGDWLPRYGLAGISDLRVREWMRAALRGVDEALAEHLPPEIVERQRLAPIGLALRDVHFPSNTQRKGRARLAFDELFQVQLGMALLRTTERRDRGTAHGILHTLLSRGMTDAGWHLTDAQELAFDAIRRDLRRSAPMERLLQGDVGSGKGAVARATMALVAEEKQQVFFCASDALSAEHHHLFAGEWWASLGVEPLLLLGPPTRVQAEALRKGETLVVYGTHALLESPPEVRKLGLVVVEQSGTYSVPVLSKLEEANQRPDLLVVTPTPVPALLAMTVYGQLSMSVLARPAGCGVQTTVLGTDRRDEAYAAAREAIAAGRQVILVFPFRDARNDLLSPSEARRFADVLQQQQLPGAKILLFSGGLTPQERFRAYDDFQHRRANVLLATTAFEEGPVVPNASVIIAEYAEGFDLVRLHRLRNHVANGWAPGQCFFVQGDGATPESTAALELVAKEEDGFRIADLDLKRRGVAAALGESAVDIPRFAWSDPAEDRDTLTRARQEAFRLLAADPGLRRRQNRPLLNLVRSRFGEEPALSDGAPPPPSSAEGNSRRRRRRRR